MGANMSCPIKLDPIDRPFYGTGDTISGNAILKNKRSVKIRSIILKIIGERCYDTKTAGTAYAPPRTTTTRENFYVEEHPIYIPLTYGVPTDADGYYILDANSYQLPFSVRLAEHLPPSLINVKTSAPYINYFVEVIVEYGSFRPNSYFKVPITVKPCMPQPPTAWPVEAEQLNFRGLHAFGRVLNHYILIDERYITLELNIHNPKNITIKEIIIKLVQHRRLGHRSGKEIIFRQQLPEIVNFQDTELHRTFQVPIEVPTISSAPTTYIAKVDKSNRPWSVDYILKVKLKTNQVFANVTLEFPLVVANSANQPQTTDEALDEI